MLNAESLTAGVNLYEAKPPEMEKCVNPDLRHSVFAWVMRKKELFFSRSLSKVPEVGVFYSTASEFYGDPSWDDDIQHTDSFFGITLMLMRLGIPFRTVTDDNTEDLEAVIVPHLTFKTERETKLLKKIGTKCRLVDDTGNLGWKFWKAAKAGPNWEKYVSSPPDEKQCARIQQEFRHMLNVKPVMEFDAASGIIPMIYYDKKRDKYILRVINLKGQNCRNIKAVPHAFSIKLSLPAEYSHAREFSFLEEKVKEFRIGKDRSISSSINLFSVYEISK
jgi:hypothetical protein